MPLQSDFAGFVFSPVFVFFIGLVAGMINVMAGGGSALTLPALIFLGLDGAEANGTNRLSILLQNVSASVSFSREKSAVRLRESFKYSLLTLPGAVCGAVAAVRIDDLLFKKTLAVVIIIVGASVFFPLFKAGAKGEKPSGRKWLLYPGLAAVGFYGGFMQAGIGLVIMALLFHSTAANIAAVNAHKIFIVMIYTVPSLGIFFFSGNVDILKGLNLAAGTALGGWWAARLSVKKGASAVRWFVALAIALSSLKLLEVF